MITGESTPMITGESTPMITGESTPMITGESTPMITGESTPMITGESTPMITGESTPMITGESAQMVTGKATLNDYWISYSDDFLPKKLPVQKMTDVSKKLTFVKSCRGCCYFLSISKKLPRYPYHKKNSFRSPH